MMIKLTAPNVVAMVLFIPILIALGVLLAFAIPILAIIVAAAGLAFTAFYMRARVSNLKKQQELGSKPSKQIEVRDYRIK